MKLYDMDAMDAQEWRERGFRRGDSFRSKQVYVCQMCRTKTNEILLGGYPGWGVQIVCPGNSFTEHDEIEKTLRRQEEVAAEVEQLSPYVDEAAHRDPAVRELMRHWEAEQLLFQVKIDVLRMKFAGVLDDVVGIGELDPAMLREYRPGMRFGGKKKSLDMRQDGH